MKLFLAIAVLSSACAFASASSLRGAAEDRLRAEIKAELKAELQTELKAQVAAFKTATTAQLNAQVAATAQLNAQITAIKATTAGELKIFVDGRTVCPKGMAEPTVTQGMVLVGRPKDGQTGATFNRPLDAGEVGRTSPHSHAVTVNDLGHTHLNGVNDPGHRHQQQTYEEGGGWKAPPDQQASDTPTTGGFTQESFTGITINNAAAKSNIQVSVDSNDAGEHYPIVYVLVCQQVQSPSPLSEAA